MMVDRPGYQSFLKYKFKQRAHDREAIVCKMDGRTRYFKDTTKNSIRIIFTIAYVLLLLIILIGIPYVFLLPLGDITWQNDYMMIALPASIFLFPVLASLRYWFSTFEIISEDEAASIRDELDYKHGANTRNLFILRYIVSPLFFFLLCFSMSLTASYIHYSIDIATHNQANQPRAECRVEMLLDSYNLDSQHISLKGYIPFTSSVKVKLNVNITNSPEKTSVHLNNQDLSTYQVYYHFGHLSANKYFVQYLEYQIPADLFKPMNTLVVESGLAKGDWTIEITNPPAAAK